MSDYSFKELYNNQMLNQATMLYKGMYGLGKAQHITLPQDDIHLSSYHIQQLVSEIGEVLDADKRWKNFRNDKYERQDKLEELADCFIVLMNVCMFSGFTFEEVYNMIAEKIDTVRDRVGEV